MRQSYRTQLISFLAALILVFAGFALGLVWTAGNANVAADQQLPQPIVEVQQHLADLYQQISPSVVAITVSQTVAALPGFDQQPDQTQVVSGSGFVIDNNGHIVTNYHVVEDGEEIIVYFLDGTITRAEVVGSDADADLAVIRVDLPEDRLHPVIFGRMDEVFVGQNVIAIGSPFGNNWTMTSGIVSALERDIPSLSIYRIGAAIQTDAPINPGNSGGPLLNLNGQVIGVNAQIASDTRANSGVGFAIPVDLVQRVAKELIENGEVAYSVIGIRGGDMYLAAMEDLDLPNNLRGVIISEVLPDSPAESAGLRSWELTEDEQHIVSADIVTAINGTPISGIGDILTYLARNTRPGDVINLSVLRDGEQITIPLTLGYR